MAGEGEFPKNDGNILYAKDVNILYAEPFLHKADVCFWKLKDDTENYVKFAPSNKILDYLVFTGIGYDGSNTTAKVTENDVTIFANVYDEFNDSSVDSSKWTTSTTGDGYVTETSTEIEVGVGTSAHGHAELITNGSSGFNGKGNDSTFMFDLKCYMSSGGSNNYVEFGVTDGTTFISLNQITSSQSEDNHYEIYFDNTNNQAKYRTINSSRNNSEGSEFGSNYSTPVDISSLSNWYVYFKAYEYTSYTSERCWLKLRTTWYVNGSSVSQDWVSNNVTHSADSGYGFHTFEANTAIVKAYAETCGGSLTLYVSTDGGTTWEQVTDGIASSLSNTGGQLKVKVSGTTSTSHPIYMWRMASRIIEL